MEQHVQYSISGIERLHMVLSYNSWALKKCSFASCWTWYQMRPTKTKRKKRGGEGKGKKKEEKQKEKMPILNRISTIKVLFAILRDWKLAKVVLAMLAACNSQAQYLQLFHKVKYVQPGEEKNKAFPLPTPTFLLGRAKRSKTLYLLKETLRHWASSSRAFRTEYRQKSCFSVVSSVTPFERLNRSLRQEKRPEGIRKPGWKAAFPRNT